MKSIKEWMKDKGIVCEDMNKLAFSRFMRGPGDAGTTMSIDTELKSKLNSVIGNIMKDEDFADEDPENLLRQIMAVVAAKLAGMTGSSISTSRVVDKMNKLGHNDEPIAQEVR
jgi:hypothetical protein